MRLANLVGLRCARGGVIGLTPGLPGCETVEELKALVDRVAGIPFEGRESPEGIAIGSDLMGVERPLPGLESARGISRWFEHSFDRKTAAAIVAGNARRLLLRSAGSSCHLRNLKPSRADGLFDLPKWQTAPEMAARRDRQATP